jgi:hypothetical protein
VAMTLSNAHRILGFPMTSGIFGEQAEAGSINRENLIRLTRRKLSAIAESDLHSWDAAEAEGECLTAFKLTAGYLSRNLEPVDATMFDSYASSSSRVRILPPMEQLELFGRSMPPQMDMSIYVSTFDCPCGSSHILNEQVSILREGLMKVLALCPEDPSYILSIKIRTLLIVRFQGLETICGSRIRTLGERKMVGQVIRGTVAEHI